MTTIFNDRSYPVEAKPAPVFALLAAYRVPAQCWRLDAFAGAPER